MTRRFGSTAGLLGLLCVGLSTAGCRSFHQEWKEARRSVAPTNDISGAWEGTWQNRNNTHQDRMRAVLTSIGSDTYRASFYAWYKRVLTFSYTTELRVERREGELVLFRGETDLGKLAGGLYRYEGHATPADFFSTYDSKYDIGTFTLRRPR